MTSGSIKGLGGMIQGSHCSIMCPAACPCRGAQAKQTFAFGACDSYQGASMMDAPGPITDERRMYSESEMKAAVAAERACCINILEGEIKRGKALIGLQDMKGKPVFDDETMKACIEAIEYCAELLREEVK